MYRTSSVCKEEKKIMLVLIFDRVKPMSRNPELTIIMFSGNFCDFKRWKTFSKLQLSQTYLQIQVKEKSSELTIINMHNGLYKLNRLPFGIKLSQDIFTQAMATMLADCDFAMAYVDDILLKSLSS